MYFWFSLFYQRKTLNVYLWEIIRVGSCVYNFSRVFLCDDVIEGQPLGSFSCQNIVNFYSTEDGCVMFRCREKQRKETSRLQTVNRKLTAMNKLLMEENDRLQKQVSRLVHENAYMRQQLQNVCHILPSLPRIWSALFFSIVLTPSNLVVHSEDP